MRKPLMVLAIAGCFVMSVVGGLRGEKVVLNGGGRETGL